MFSTGAVARKEPGSRKVAVRHYLLRREAGKTETWPINTPPAWGGRETHDGAKGSCFLPRCCFILFFQCLSKFSVFNPQPRPGSSDSVQRQPPPTIAWPRGAETCEKNKQQQTTFLPKPKASYYIKDKAWQHDRRGYNSYFPLTNSELIFGLFLAARLMLKTKGKASHASQRAQLCSVATSSLGSRLCGGLKQQLRAVWTPLHMMGKLLLFPAR